MPGILDLSRSDPGGILPDWLPRGPRTPAHDLVALGWRGLQALAPNITNSATYAPLPPPAWTPTPEGKLPSSDRDPRVEGVMADLLVLQRLVAIEDRLHVLPGARDDAMIGAVEDQVGPHRPPPLRAGGQARPP
jgi:hypothetical protein